MFKLIQGIFLLTAFSASATAASFVVSNVTDGLSDTVYTGYGNLLNGGVVTIGYFNPGFDVSSAAADLNIAALLVNFTIVNSAQIGGFSPTLGGSFAGYAESGISVDLGTITTSNPLFGRDLYSFLGDSQMLAASGALGLLKVGVIGDDSVFQHTYSSNPAGAVLLLGSAGTISGNLAGTGEGSHPAVDIGIPEASSTMLVALGVCGLLARRRRI